MPLYWLGDLAVNLVHCLVLHIVVYRGNHKPQLTLRCSRVKVFCLSLIQLKGDILGASVHRVGRDPLVGDLGGMCLCQVKFGNMSASGRNLMNF
jgi:hypothetical protein